MTRTLAAMAALIALTGCDILFPEDPRLGVEPSEECPTRVAALLGPGTSYHAYDGDMGVPIFTFDITKMGFEDMQSLMVEGSDDTAGARTMAATNETSTAVARFMRSNVDEKGAFFMGRDPALFRVRGALQPVSTMIGSGCARQLDGMRLIMIDVAPASSASEPESSDTDAPTETGENENN